VSLQEISQKAARAAEAVGRRADDVNLIAVSKIQPNERVEAVLKQGHRVFGENKVQEAQRKWPDFKAQFDGIAVHLIGPLQSNKTRAAMELFDAIHSVDRPKLAKGIARIAQELGHCPELFIQVNTGEEPQKAGVLPGDVDAFVAECRSMDLPITGLMCIPPAAEEPTLHFALLAKMAKRNGLVGLSMGMSSDFERAITQGATHIRVGSAIFGTRVS